MTLLMMEDKQPPEKAIHSGIANRYKRLTQTFEHPQHQSEHCSSDTMHFVAGAALRNFGTLLTEKVYF
jgi:hypothetical protein